MVEPHKGDVVGFGRGVKHRLGHLGKFPALVRCGALRCETRHQPLQLASNLKQSQLKLQIDLGNHDAASGHYYHKAVSCQTLQGLANWRPADLQTERKGLLRQDCSRQQSQGNDHFLEFAVGAICQRTVFGIIRVGSTSG